MPLCVTEIYIKSKNINYAIQHHKIAASVVYEMYDDIYGNYQVYEPQSFGKLNIEKQAN